jgi:hypothetical protein
MQGVYRLWHRSRELRESFVAAPGPMGWRYFGRVHEPEGPELFVIDHVVDGDWNLVRFRSVDVKGAEVIAVPAAGGVEVSIRGPAADRTERVDGATAVWSVSPSSLLVLDRRVGGLGGTVSAVRLEPGFDPESITVQLSRRPSPGGVSTAEEVDVIVDGRPILAVIREGVPLSAEGWFELMA